MLIFLLKENLARPGWISNPSNKLPFGHKPDALKIDHPPP